MFDVYDEHELESLNFSMQLKKLNIHNYEASWQPTRITAFISAVETVMKQKMPWNHRVEWSGTESLKDPVLRLEVINQNWGTITADIPVKLVKSKDVPENLPEQITDIVIEKFNKKINRLVKQAQR